MSFQMRFQNWGLCAVTAVLAGTVACSDSSSDTAVTGGVTTTPIGSDGGTAQSSDDQLEASFEAGALDSNVDVRISTITGVERDGLVSPVYQLETLGTGSAVRVQVRLRVPAGFDGASLVLADAGDGVALPNASYDAQARVLAGTLEGAVRFGAFEANSVCYVGGCAREACTDSPTTVTLCEWRPSAVCYEQFGRCGRFAENGACGWQQTDELTQCVAERETDIGCGLGVKVGDSVPSVDQCNTCTCIEGGQLRCTMQPCTCFVAGCSGELCTDDPGMASTCEWRPEYACFKQYGLCGRPGTGSESACGWMASDRLAACVAKATGEALCGGVSDVECPSGQRCADDPGDDCAPSDGGVDCLGVCIDE